MGLNLSYMGLKLSYMGPKLTFSKEALVGEEWNTKDSENGGASKSGQKKGGRWTEKWPKMLKS